MGLLLNVPYLEKDEAKALGARWNPTIKKWYSSSPQDYPLFYKWIDLPHDEVQDIIIGHFYIVEGERPCFKCNKTTKVICFGIEDFYEVLNPEDYGTDIEFFYYYTNTVHLIPSLPTSCIPTNFWDYLSESFHFYWDVSKQGGKYRANHCQFCKAIQGRFPLFCEPDSPFFITNQDDASKLVLYKVHLKNDMVVGDVIDEEGSHDSLIKPYAKIVDTGWEL